MKEYGHKCAMEYTVTYPECENCVKTRRSAYKKENCCCVEMPHYASEQCPKCVTIQNDICYLKSEIQRTAMNYGMEVAASLETKPDFAEDIENLVVRIKIMERLLIIQKIETEVKCEPDLNGDADNMSVVSFDDDVQECEEDADDDCSRSNNDEEEEESAPSELFKIARDLTGDFEDEDDVESAGDEDSMSI